jgi:hypothetical protein
LVVQSAVHVEDNRSYLGWYRGVSLNHRDPR